MRKITVGVLLLASAIVMAGMAYARSPLGSGSGSCCLPDCSSARITTEQWQKYRTDSLGLREQMMTRKFELEKEELQPHPDNTKVARLESEISSLRSSIHDLRTKAGLAVCYQGGAGCRSNGINGDRGNGMGIRGQGMGRCNQ